MTTQEQIVEQKRKTLEAFLEWKLNQQKLEELVEEEKKEMEEYHKKKRERNGVYEQ